jgi:hypothetical protein
MSQRKTNPVVYHGVPDFEANGAERVAARRETPLSRALRRMARGTRLSSLDVPVLEDAADEIDDLTALRSVPNDSWRDL